MKKKEKVNIEYWKLRNRLGYAVIAGDKTRLMQIRKEINEFCRKHGISVN